MTFEEAVDLLLAEVNSPPTQRWVTIEALKKAAENLDDDQSKRCNS